MDFLHGPPKNPAKNFGIVEVGNHTCKIAPKASSLTQKLTRASHPIKQKGRNVLQKIFFSITVQHIRLKSKCSAIQYTKLKSSQRLNDEVLQTLGPKFFEKIIIFVRFFQEIISEKYTGSSNSNCTILEAYFSILSIRKLLQPTKM